MSRYSPSRRDLSRIRVEADAFGASPLNVHSMAALKRAKAALRRTVREGLTPDTSERQAQYNAAIIRIHQEIERRSGTLIELKPVKVKRGERSKDNPDYVFTSDGSGSIWLVRATNEVAQKHLEENVQEDASWWGTRLVVEHRYVGNLATALGEAGYFVRIED
jgi:hypothetical protein